jgi:hypothetical protein
MAVRFGGWTPPATWPADSGQQGLDHLVAQQHHCGQGPHPVRGVSCCISMRVLRACKSLTENKRLACGTRGQLMRYSRLTHALSLLRCRQPNPVQRAPCRNERVSVFAQCPAACPARHCATPTSFRGTNMQNSRRPSTGISTLRPTTQAKANKPSRVSATRFDSAVG